MTTIAEIKSTLHQYIVETDDVEVLNELRIYFETLLQPDKTIVYTTTGEPLSRESYQQDLDEAIAQANRGEVISQLDIEKNQS